MSNPTSCIPRSNFSHTTSTSSDVGVAFNFETKARATQLVSEEALPELRLDGPGWTPVDEGIYLVCTHGKHDPCCAIR